METTIIKKCSICKETKNISEFHKDKLLKYGVSSFCKFCAYNKTTAYNRTKIGLINRLYKSQKANSKRRRHNPPKYSKQVLIDWLENDWLFNLMYDNWKSLGYSKNLSPSIDRIDDNIGYELDNIQLMTWGENKAKAKLNSVLRKRVAKTNVFYEIIETYESVREAGRLNNLDPRAISRCCNKYKRYVGGYKWKFI